MKKMTWFLGASLLLGSMAFAQNDPTATPEKMADILRSQIMEFRSLRVKALVVGSEGQGVALLAAAGAENKPFQVRAGNVIAREMAGLNVRLIVKAVTAEGIEIEAPTLTEKLLIPSAFKLEAPTQPAVLKAGELRHIECNAVSIEEVLRLIADQTGVNISVSAQSAATPVTIFLRNVPASVAVEELCRSRNLWFRADEKTGVVRVTTMSEYENSLTTFREEQTKSFTLLYPNVVEVASVLYGLYPDRVYLSLGERDILEDEKDDLSRRFERLEMFDNSSSSTLLSLSPGNVNSMGGASGNTWDSSRNNQYNDRYANQREKFTGVSADAAKRFEAARVASGPATNDVRRMLDVFRDKAPSIFVTVSRRNNMVIIRTSDPEVMREIEALIRRLDVPTPSVLLEMKIMQVDLDNSFSSSFEFELNGKTTIDGKTVAGLAGFPGIAPLSAEGRTDTATFRVISDHFSTRIQLLESTGKAKTLATPTMLVANNEVSRLFIGERMPITTGVTMEPVNGTVNQVVTTVGYTVEPQIEMQAIGTMLLVTPNINADRSVTLRLMQEESSVNPNGGTIPYGSAAALQSYKVDTVLSRRISGTFLAHDRLLTAIGGLITETQTEEISRVPFFGRIPLLGFFFRSKEKVNKRSELVILIRPHVISTPVEGEAISRRLLDRIVPAHAETLFSTNAVPTNLPPAVIEDEFRKPGK